MSVLNSPLVSIIIPVYNGSNYLKEAIDSALNQTYRNVEIIVVNDGSCDNRATEEIALSYGKKIRYYSKKNGGTASALNYGITHMKGEYFSWLSHDDKYYKNKIESQMQFLIKSTQAKVVFCDTDTINKNGKYIRKNVYRNKVTEKIRGAHNFFKIWVYACSLLVHKSCFEKIGLFNEDRKTTQDVLFTLLLLYHFDVHHVSEALVQRRDHVESGYYVLNEEIGKELSDLFFFVLNKYDISFFFTEISAGNSNYTLSKAYNQLGNLMLHYDWARPFILQCYEKSSELNKTLFNFAKYKQYPFVFMMFSFITLKSIKIAKKIKSLIHIT